MGPHTDLGKLLWKIVPAISVIIIAILFLMALTGKLDSNVPFTLPY